MAKKYTLAPVQTTNAASKSYTFAPPQTAKPQYTQQSFIGPVKYEDTLMGMVAKQRNDAIYGATDLSNFQYKTVEEYDAAISALNQQLGSAAVADSKRQSQSSADSPAAWVAQLEFGRSEDVKKLSSQLDTLRAERTLLERANYIDTKYGGLNQNPDFAAQSAPMRHDDDATYIAVNKDNYNDLFPRTYEGQYGWVDGQWVTDKNAKELAAKYGWNNAETSNRIAAAVAGQQDAALLAGEASNASEIGELEWLRDEERKIYNYLYNSRGAEAANTYLDDMKIILQRRQSNATAYNTAQAYEGAGSVGKGLMNVGTFIAKPVGSVVAAINDVAETVSGEYSPYGGAHTLQTFADTVRGATSQNIYDAIVKNGGGEGAAQLFSTLYQAGMSAGDSILGGLTLGSGYLALAAADAATHKAKELYENGAQGWQIAVGSVASGAIEALMEKLPLDELQKMARGTSGLKAIVKNILIQSGIEGAEEALTETANLVADSIIQGGNSDLSRQVAAYESDGYTTEQAQQMAARDKMLDVMWATVAGMASGAGSAGAFSSVGMVKDYGYTVELGNAYLQSADKLNQAVAIGLDNAHTTDAYRQAQGLQTMIKEGKAEAITAYQVGKMLRGSMTKEAKTARLLDNKVRESAAKYGVSADTAEAVANVAASTGREIEFVSPEELRVTDGGAQGQYSIQTLPNGKRFVKADRQVILGTNPKQWAEQVRSYIDTTIRHGQDVVIYAADGDPLTITQDTSGKARFRNDIRLANGTTRPMTDSEYATKLRAETHIDELATVSSRGKSVVPDSKNHAFAKDGFNYRTAYFMDNDGQYYRLTISVGKNGAVNTIYNVGKIKEADFPLSGSKAASKNDATGSASNTKIPQNSIGVNSQFMQDDAKYASGYAAGRYENGRILLNSRLSTEEAVNFVVKHELVHSVEGTKEWQQLAKIVRAKMGEDGWNKAKAEVEAAYAANGQTLDDGGVEREVIANWIGDNLYKSGFAQAIVSGDATVGNAFVRTIDRLRLALGTKNSRAHTSLAVVERLFMRALQNEGVSGEGAYSLNKHFAQAYDAWDKKDPHVVFEVGTTSSALKAIGIPSQKITWDASKIIKIKNKHPEMTDAIIKQVPTVLENPIVIMRSKNHASRLTMFGELFSNDKPVLVILELNPTDRRGIALEEMKIASAYGKDSPQAFIDSSNVLFVSNDEKRVNDWKRRTGLQLPVGQSIINSNTTIPQNGGGVNTQYMQKGGQNALFSFLPTENAVSQLTAEDTEAPVETVSFGDVHTEAVRHAAQAERAVAQGNTWEELAEELGEDELIKRQYMAMIQDDLPPALSVDGQEISTAAYMDAVEELLPDDRASLEAFIQQAEAQQAQEVATAYADGTIEAVSALPITVQLYAARRKLELLPDTGEEDGSKTRRFYWQRTRGLDANKAHEAELLDYLAGRSEKYSPISNKETLDRAKDELAKPGYAESLVRRLGRGDAARFDEVDEAAVMLRINAARNDGDLETYTDMVQKLSRLGTKYGRMVQILSIMARMTPEGTLKAAKRTFRQEIDRVHGEGTNQAIDNLSEDLVDAVERAASANGSQEPAMTTQTETDRAERLRNRRITAVPSQNITIPNVSLEELEHRAKSKAEDVIYPLAEKIGILNKTLRTPELDISFELTKSNGLKASLSHQLKYGGNYADLAKVLLNLDTILQNAVLIERHTDKYVGTERENSNLIDVSVLIGLLQDENGFIPVQFEVKHLRDSPNKLYLTVALTKEEVGVMGDTTDAAEPHPPRNLLPTSDYSLTELFRKINPQDKEFLKYVPDDFLTEEQKVAKQQALAEEKHRILSYATREELMEGLTENIRRDNSPYITREQIRGILDRAVEKATDIPAQMKKLLTTDEVKDSLAKKIETVYQAGHLNEATMRQAFEEALELPTLSTDDVQTLIGMVNEMQATEEGSAERAEAEEAIYRFLGEKLPVTRLEAFAAWRKFAMLANLKTHVRNIASNAVMHGAVNRMDSAFATILQRLFIDDSAVRTAYLGWSHTEQGKALRPALEKSAEKAVVRMQSGEGKYDITASRLGRYKKNFGTGRVGEAFNEANEFNSNWLEREDVWFFKPAYIDALGQIMVARRMTEVTQEVEELAYKKALETTFRAENAVHDLLMLVKRWGNGNKKVKKLAGYMTDVVIPFSKTPANIAAQSITHSPIGLLDGAWKMAKATLDGDAQAKAAAINEMAKGMTGTLLFGVGILLGSLGLFRTGFGKTEKERAADELAGIQENSMQIWNVSVTLDWLQPTAAPLIVGASFAQRLKEDGLQLGSVFGAVMDGTDALFELSMLQSLYDVLGGYNAGASASAFSVLENTVSQSIPTVVGQLARTIDPVARKTKGDNGFETAVNQVLAKIPGLTYLLDPQLDVWGNEVYRTGKASTGSAVLNAFQQVLLPANHKIATGDDEISRMVLALYENADSKPSRAIPSVPDRDMAAELGMDYTALRKLVGGTNRQAVSDFMNDRVAYTVQVQMPSGKLRNVTKKWSAMNEEERLRVLNRIYTKTKQQVEEPDDEYFMDLMRRVQNGN